MPHSNAKSNELQDYNRMIFFLYPRISATDWGTRP
jgi:hypothetical protein